MTEPTGTPDTATLLQSKCVPCEGGVPKLTPEQAQAFGRATPRWNLDESGESIR